MQHSMFICSLSPNMHCMYGSVSSEIIKIVYMRFKIMGIYG